MSFGDDQPEPQYDGAPDNREAPSSQLDDSFTDDSSSVLGIGHHATRVDGFEWNERQNRKERARLEAAGIPFGAPPPEKGPSNRGAYLDVSKAIDEVRKEFPALPEVEIVQLGRQRAEEAARLGETDASKGRDADYLGDSVTNLMKHDVEISGGSRSGRKHEDPPNADAMADRRQRNYDEILSDETGPLSEEERARRMHARNVRSIEGRRGSGRPLKGSEPRMKISGRIEPGVVVEMHEMTGMGVIE